MVQDPLSPLKMIKPASFAGFFIPITRGCKKLVYLSRRSSSKIRLNSLVPYYTKPGLQKCGITTKSCRLQPSIPSILTNYFP